MHGREWNQLYENATHGCFVSDQEAVYSELCMYEFMEKCIMPMAEQSKVLFVTNYANSNSFNIAFDEALIRLKKQNADRDLQVEVLCICREEMHFINSM